MSVAKKKTSKQLDTEIAEALGALRDGWSISPIYRGSTTVRGYSTSFRGSGGPSFDRRRDAVAWVNESGSGFERQLASPHRTHVKLAPGSDRFRAYCDCGWFSPVKYRDRAAAETEAQQHAQR